MRKLAIIALLLLVQGCTSIYTLEPITLSRQHEVYKDGLKTVHSMKNVSVAVMQTVDSYQSTSRPSLLIGIKNYSSSSFVFSIKDMEVLLEDTLVKIFSYRELIDEAEQSASDAMLSHALSGLNNAINSDQYGYTYHRGFTDNYNTAYSGYTYDPLKSQQARIEANRQMLYGIDQKNKHLKKTRKRLDTVIKKTTINPGDWYGGVIFMDKIPYKNESQTIQLKVNAGGESHIFNLKLYKKH